MVEFRRMTAKEVRENELAHLIIKAVDKMSPPPPDKYTVIGKVTGDVPGNITIEVMHFDCIDVDEEDTD